MSKYSQQVIRSHKSSGIALISVLLVVAFGSVLVADMFKQQHRTNKRQEFFLAKDHVISIALGVEEWASAGLYQAGETDSVTALNQIWTQYVPPVPFEFGAMGGFTVDLNRYFNINNLLEEKKNIQAQWLKIWKRFVKNHDIEEEWTNVLLDWLDKDSKIRDDSFEEETYLLKSPPYRAANQAMLHIEEMTQIHNFEEKWLPDIKNSITAVPITKKIKAKINVNTARPDVLQALHEKMTSEIVNKLALERKENPFITTKAFIKYIAPELGLTVANATAALSNDIITVNSNFFQLNAQIDLAGVSNALYVVLYRDSKNKVSVLHRWMTPLDGVLLPDFDDFETNESL